MFEYVIHLQYSGRGQLSKVNLGALDVCVCGPGGGHTTPILSSSKSSTHPTSSRPHTSCVEEPLCKTSQKTFKEDFERNRPYKLSRIAPGMFLDVMHYCTWRFLSAPDLTLRGGGPCGWMFSLDACSNCDSKYCIAFNVFVGSTQSCCLTRGCHAKG